MVKVGGRRGGGCYCVGGSIVKTTRIHYGPWISLHFFLVYLFIYFHAAKVRP